MDGSWMWQACCIRRSFFAQIILRIEFLEQSRFNGYSKVIVLFSYYYYKESLVL